jgi:hypothetical protein
VPASRSLSVFSVLFSPLLVSSTSLQHHRLDHLAFGMVKGEASGKKLSSREGSAGSLQALIDAATEGVRELRKSSLLSQVVLWQAAAALRTQASLLAAEIVEPSPATSPNTESPEAARPPVRAHSLASASDETSSYDDAR